MCCTIINIIIVHNYFFQGHQESMESISVPDPESENFLQTGNTSLGVSRAVSIMPIQDLNRSLFNSSSEESLTGLFQKGKTHIKSIRLKKV